MNFLSYLKKHVFYILGIILFVVGTGLLLLFSPIKNPEQVESQEILLAGISLDNWGIWITIIGAVLASLWAMYQYSKNFTFKQQEIACAIAKDFADSLIERMGMISQVLTHNKEVERVLKLLSKYKIAQFTLSEISEIISESDIQIFMQILKSKNTQNRYKKILNERYSKKEQEKFESKFTLLIDKTLNQLEAICISISSQAAGSQFIYESLHQMFFNTVEVLSIRISFANNNNVDKYYTHITSVYNMWSLQKMKDIKKLNKTAKKIKKIENKVQKEIKKLQTKQTKTV